MEGNTTTKTETLQERKGTEGKRQKEREAI